MKDNSNEMAAFDSETIPNGDAWAALLSASIGAIAFGIITDMSECSEKVSGLLQWYRPAGALSGVGISAVAIWIATWVALQGRWKSKRLQNQRTILAVTIILSLAALLTTFPPFYELLSG